MKPKPKTGRKTNSLARDFNSAFDKFHARKGMVTVNTWQQRRRICAVNA